MNEYKKLVAKLYAMEKSGLSCEKELTIEVKDLFALTKQELEELYNRFAEEINRSGLAKTDKAFREMLYLKHIEYFFDRMKETQND